MDKLSLLNLLDESFISKTKRPAFLSLEEILYYETETNLKNLFYTISTTHSNLPNSKKEIIDSLLESYNNNISNILYSLDFEAFAFLSKIISNNSVLLLEGNLVDNINILGLEDLGLIFLCTHKEKPVFFIPTFIESKIKDISTRVFLKNSQTSILIKGFLHYYGAINASELYILLQKHISLSLNIENFKFFLHVLSTLNQEFIYENSIASSIFLDNITLKLSLLVSPISKKELTKKDLILASSDEYLGPLETTSNLQLALKNYAIDPNSFLKEIFKTFQIYGKTEAMSKLLALDKTISLKSISLLNSYLLSIPKWSIGGFSINSLSANNLDLI